MSVDMDKLFQEFNDYADNSKQFLQKMLAVISEGKVPEQKSVDELEDSIENLRKRYASVYKAALAQLPEGDMPEEGMPAAEYVEAVRRNETLQYKKKLEMIRGCLEKFISVRALIERYTFALMPFQEQAEELMKKLDTDIDLESISKKILGPESFLKAIACDNFDSEENYGLLEGVGDYFTPQVMLGVATQNYYIDAGENDRSLEKFKTISMEQQEAESIEECAVTLEAECRIESEECRIKSETEIEAESISKPVSEPVSPPQSDALQESKFVSILRRNEAFLESDKLIGLFSYDISPYEEKRVTSSVFINDMRKGNEIVEKLIIREIIRKSYITGVLGTPEYFTSPTLSYLFQKGYLRKYKMLPDSEFYCASSRLKKALAHKEGSKFIGVRQKAVEEWGTPIEDKETSIATRMSYVKLHEEYGKWFLERGVDVCDRKTSTMTDAFWEEYFGFKDRNEEILLIGAFWSTTEECDEFVNMAEARLAELKEIDIVIFAGINADKAKAVADSLLEMFDIGSKSKALYLYSLSDGGFYDYPHKEKVDKTDIFKSQDKDTKVSEPVMSTEENEKSQPAEDCFENTKKSELSVYENILKMAAAKRFYAATAYAKSCAASNPDIETLYVQLAYAVNDPMGQCNYSTDNAFDLISKHSFFEDALTVSTAIRVFFSNQVRYDYNIKPFYNGIKDYAILNKFPTLGKIVYSLMEFKDTQKKGMDVYAGYCAKSQSELEQEIVKLRQEASVFYDNFVRGKKKETAKSRRFLETKKLIFSVNSDIGQFIKDIVDGNHDVLSLVNEFLQENFFKEDVTISENTIDGSKLWNYIETFWNIAGDNMVYRRHEKLMSQFRSNIISMTMKAVQLLAKWCNLVEHINNQTEDEGTIAYKKLRKSLLENLENAVAELDKETSKTDVSREECAGLQVIRYTLSEVKSYIDGTYSEIAHKYFYAPFLLTDDVLLDEKLVPDLDVHSSAIQAIQPKWRVLEHFRKVMKEEKSYENRLSEIISEQGDDYGTARLIAEFLAERNEEQNPEDVLEIIETSEGYAKDNAKLRKDDFIGELELAQSYGQIDNSEENKKEKILQIVDEWYEWAVLTSNYGFFKKVLDSYILEIREKAKIREKDLSEQLNGFKETVVSGLTAEAKEKKIEQIKKMIKEQNYTVAEDLLARAFTADEENEELNEEDFLKEFLDNYDDYYQPVATHKSNFASLVSSRTRNKEERGAKRLADNWLPGGSSLGKERLKNLLTYLGFHIESVKPQSSIGKFENFAVLTAHAQNGQRNNYTHPIAAFGSGASEAGFRVVCINGVYDAEGLIDVMKQIGNAKHTLILFDCALSKSERRRLARKTKNALGDKLFGVIDRTVMMFLVRNYDETKINRMLISLITPFGYYQPYVWESANVMPPEIFMGRKHELECIKSASGVNIVYGGRQLGKSALLKKAKDDINWDENGDRAVYVEIKGLNYEEAAVKIGHELFDQNILDEDIETTNWDELARMIKRRLQSQEKKIPYLLLLLDEADAFIESCEPVNYKPFDALKDVQSIGVGRFKFVIAGLRNIVRFKREAALGNNSVLTHLESMTVKPFNTSEARELMEIPLHYLGLRFPKEKESLITLILATTNYFPGLIQLYCAKLIDAMRNKDYAGYDEANTPIYEVSEKHIKKVLADPEFTQQIREKYVITLKLDEDNYYYLIALLMAYLYHNNGYNNGYSAVDIKKAGVEYGISKIANLDNSKLTAFMEELRDLNVLRNTDETHYLFTRFTFFQMMGTSTDIDDKLEKYMEG